MSKAKHPRAIVKEMDPNLKEDDEGFKAAMVLVGAAQVGTSAEKIAERTGLPRSLVRKYVKRARQQRIFQRDQIACDWFDEEHGGVAFWLDVCVLRGLMNKKAGK